MALLRRIWGYGIAVVMIAAVGPYPVLGIVRDDEIIHRIHNTVGSVHYLVLWAVPVLLWAHSRRDASMWRLALVTSLTMFVVSSISRDLVGSLSWMPLATLLALWPLGPTERRWWVPERRPSLLAIAAAATLWWVAAERTWPLVEVQRLSAADVHGARYHYSGMASATFSLAAGATVLAFFGSRRRAAAVVTAASVLIGVAYLLWPEYDSGIPARWAWMYIAAAVLLAPLAFGRWRGSQTSSSEVARTPSSSSPPRPITHS